MTIETKLEFKKYLKLMFILSVRKSSMLTTTLIGLIIVLLAFIQTFDPNFKSEEFPFSLMIFGIVFLVFMPVIIYLNAKSNFSTNGKLKETIVYEFTNEKMKITGETFSSEMDWSKIYKVLELKNWILIYQSKLIANAIPKESFDDNLESFKEIVRNKNIKVKFK